VNERFRCLGRFYTIGGGDDHTLRERLCTVLLEKLLNHSLGLAVFTFAEVVISNASFAVDEVVCRPVFIVKARQIL